MSITRIQNNQITDSTIVAYAKLQAGSLTGNLFAPSVTLNSNVTINGNLFLANTGNTAIVNATNTYINDPVVVFNNGYGGSLTGYDIGMLVNRNLSPMLPYGNQVNTAWMWVENDQAFEAIATTDTGTGSVGITSLGFANIKVGNSTITGSQTVGGTFSVTGASTFNTLTGASFQGVIGNVTPATAAFTTATTSGLQATAIGNITPGTAAFTTATTNGLQVVALGNITPGTAAFTTQTTGGLQAVAIGNVTPGTAAFTTQTTGGLQAVAIGNVTPGTGSFTTLTATTLNAATIGNASAVLYGTLNGASASQTNITTVGTLTALSVGASGLTTLANPANNNGLAYSSGALQVTGGAGFGGNVYIGGNAIVTGNIVTGGNVNVVNVSGNSAQFFGNAAGFGALYAGINSGFVYQPQTVLQSSTNFNGYAQLNHQNINGGSQASTDYVATANNGSANDTYIDMGIASSTYNYAGFGIIKPNDGYLLVQGNATTGGGNLVLTSGLNDIVFAPGGSNANNEYGRINASNVFVIKSTVASTSTTTGAMTIAGGLGIGGNFYSGGSASITGALAVNTITGASFQGVIGNVTPNSGAFTSLSSTTTAILNTVTGASFQGVIGNVTPASATFTTQTTGGLQAVAIGNVTPGTAAFTTATAGGLQATAIGNVTPGSGAFTTGTFSSTLGVTGATTLSTATTGGLQAVAIGNVTPGTGAFTTLSASTTTTAGAINATYNPASASGSAIQVVGKDTQGGIGYLDFFKATNTTSGGTNGNKTFRINSTGGLEIVNSAYSAIILQLTDAGVLNTASIQNTPIGSTTASTGAFTTLSASTTTTGGLQAVAIGNVTPGTAVFTTATTGGLQAVAIGNVTPGTGAFTSLNSSTTAAFNTVTGASFQGVIGNVTQYAGSFTALNASGIAQVTNNTDNSGTTYSSGALQVTGGAGFGGNVYIGGNLFVQGITYESSTQIISGNEVVAGVITANSGTASTSTTTGALLVNGGAGITGAVYAGSIQNTPIGSATPNTGAFTTMTASTLSAGTIGNVGATLTGTLSTASQTNVTSLGTLTGLTVSGSTNLQSTTATTLQAATIGNVGATLTGTLSTASQTNVTALGTLTGLTVSGSTNLQATTATTVQAATIGNVGATLTGTLSTASQTNVTTLGSLTGLTVAGSTNLQATTATTVQAATIGNTGAVLTGTLSTAAQPNVTSLGTLTSLAVTGLSALNTVTGASFQGVIGNVNANSATFTTVVAGGLQVSAIGNVTPGTAAFTTQTTGGLQAVAIGNVTPGTAAFTTQTTGGLQAVAIGNVTPGSGAFTTLYASGITQITNGTASTAYTNGALIVSGGVGVAGAMNVNSTLSVNSTITTPTGSGSNLTLDPDGAGAVVVASSGQLLVQNTTASTSTTTGALQVSGGVGISGNLNVGNATSSIHKLFGNIVIGSGVSETGSVSTLIVNQNPAPMFNSTSTAHFFGVEGSTAKLTIDSVGTTTTSMVVARKARGTALAPTAAQTGDALGSFIARGYGTTGFLLSNAVASAGMVVTAVENFTDTAQGSKIDWNVITAQSNIASPGMTLNHDRQLTVYNTVTAPNVYVLNSTTVGNILSVLGTSNFANTANFDGRVTINNSTPTNDTTTGALVVQGGIATQGNLNAAGQLFVGTGSQTTVLTNAFTVERGTSATGPGTQYTQHAIINDTNTGSSDYIAYGNNYPGPNNDHGWLDAGFTGDAFSDPVYSITKANDGYLFASGANATVGGNLVLSTDYSGSYNDIVIGVGSFYANSEVARFHGNTSNNGTFVVKLPTNATGAVSANTGALQVYGGASFGGNVYTGGAATFNGAQSNNFDVKVKGVNTTNLLWARPNSTYDTVVVGNTLSTASITNGAKLIVNSTDSMLIPSGTTGQRPSSMGYSDVAGMIRFNTSLNSVEFYNGTAWQAPTSTFTVITDQQFTATGLTASFTLTTATTTAATLVSINGVVQIPALAYVVTGGTTLTFTENPTAGDIIDVRTLSTSTTVGALSDGTGVNSYTTSPGLTTDGNVGLIFTTGKIGTGPINQYGIDSQGGFVTMSPNVTVATTGVTTVVDNLFANSYSSAEYTITSTIQGTNIREITKILMIHNGNGAGAGTANVTVISNLNTAGNTLVTWSAGTTGNIAQLKATTTNNNTIMRIKRDYQAI